MNHQEKGSKNLIAQKSTKEEKREIQQSPRVTYRPGRILLFFRIASPAKFLVTGLLLSGHDSQAPVGGTIATHFPEKVTLAAAVIQRLHLSSQLK